MLRSLQKEIKQRKKYLLGKNINSIYFGGGTPSILNITEIEILLKIIFKSYKINNNAEITVECNPDDLNIQKLESYKKIGINRLSIGIQSFDDSDLKFMNRSHNSKEAIKSITLAKKIGFKNISVDLIYGLPKQTLKKWSENLDIMFGLGVNHFSAYSLTIEEKTALYQMVKNKKIKVLSDVKTIKQFKFLQNKSKEYGFIHYEISNFGKKGYFSNHNMAYWKNNHYLGIGPSAHSYNGYSRRWNVSSNTQYISKINNNYDYFAEEHLSTSQQYNEYVFLSLRTMWGLDITVISKKFGNTIKLHFLKEVKKWESKKYVDHNKNIYTLTTRGKNFADSIASDLFIIF